MFIALLSWFTFAEATTPVHLKNPSCPERCLGYLENDFTIVPPDAVKKFDEELAKEGGVQSLLVTVVKLDGAVEFSVGGTVLSERNLIDPKTATYQVAVPEAALDRGVEISITNLGRNSPVWELSIEGSSKPLEF
ncbi:MAG: hypothetical protein ABMA64_14280 [Myxococcota bacterium]